MAIPRTPPTASKSEWEQKKPTMRMAQEHMLRMKEYMPESWHGALDAVAEKCMGPQLRKQLTDAEYMEQPPEWAQAWDFLQALADYEDQHGDKLLEYHGDDVRLRKLVKNIASHAIELDVMAIGMQADLNARMDLARLLVRMWGIQEDKALKGEPGIKRVQCEKWWRRRLRRHIERKVEGGHISMGLVHKGTGGYISDEALAILRARDKANAVMMEKTIFRNEAGQKWRLSELQKLGVSNPIIRGGELMTRIRGAEEYADARAHVGLFITLTTPSRFHAVKMGSGGRPFPNPRYEQGLTPRDSQDWLCANWSKVRSKLDRLGIKRYGLRVAEPHHDTTAHWHMMLWTETEADAERVEEVIRDYWLEDSGNERGARENRVDFKRLVKGGAAGYLAKYITKNVGQMALLEHQDVVDGQQITMDFGPVNHDDMREVTTGHERAQGWARYWGIRQFQAFGMPSVTVWRELRRVCKDQLELFIREGDRATARAYQACHRHGNLKADWKMFMENMGGHCLARKKWHMRVWRQENTNHKPDAYGEVKPVGKAVGLTLQRGRMAGHKLVSRLMDWRPVVGEEAEQALAEMKRCEEEGLPVRTALPAAWTRFNNCASPRMGSLGEKILGPGSQIKHHASDWMKPDVVNFFRALRAKEAREQQ